MPRCWYVLLRFWLRVDHVLVRLREARLFCQFDTPERAGVVLREVGGGAGRWCARMCVGVCYLLCARACVAPICVLERGGPRDARRRC